MRKRRDARDRVLADVNGTLPPDRKPLGMGVVKSCKLDHIFGMLSGVERADHVSPFAGEDTATVQPRVQFDRHSTGTTSMSCSPVATSCDKVFIKRAPGRSS